MPDYYNYNSGGSGSKPPSDGNNNNDLMGWIIVVIALVAFWPVGLALLFRKLGEGSRPQQKRQHPYDAQNFGSRQTQTDGQTQTDEQAKTDAQTWTDGQAEGEQVTWQNGKQPNGEYHYQYKYEYKPKQSHAKRKNTTGYAPPQYEAGTAKRGAPKGKQNPALGSDLSWMTVVGIILAAGGMTGILSTMGELWGANTGILTYLADVFPVVGLAAVGGVLICAGAMNSRKRKRYRKYLALIGKRDSIAISTLAQTLGVSVRTACNDLQNMLDDGALAVGYVDMLRGRLVLTADGMADEEPQERAQPEPEKPKDENEFLLEIKAVNDDIDDEVMSRKIDRIGEITGKILDYQRKNPNKASAMRSFLNYYLPTTLKILRAYAQLEAQGIEGENITLAKERIEGMMDKVVEGFEKQLDKLFQGDAMDITTDVAVLEKMLDNDGLSGGGLTMTL